MIDMKTDLSKILSVSGHHGLYKYVAQARNGVVAESLSDGRRCTLDLRSRMTTLGDIAIYTSAGELKLREVFVSLGKVLDGKAAAGSKAPDAEIKALFAKAVPDYDDTRFYLSHMKKVVDWYNELVSYASLDFEEEESGENE